jgi:hypothetical protein
VRDEAVALGDLVAQQLAAARHVVGVLGVPARAVALAPAAAGVPAGAEDGLHVVDQRLVHRADLEGHGGECALSR